MAHKDDILEYLKSNPNKWFTSMDIMEKFGLKQYTVSKALTQLYKWNVNIRYSWFEYEKTMKYKGTEYKQLIRCRVVMYKSDDNVL